MIEDTLTLSLSPTLSLAQTSPSRDEGDPLTLTVEASSKTVQRTHLFVTWYLHTEEEGNPHPIISLDRDLIMSPGLRFRERYRNRTVELVKEGQATYRLNIAHLEPSDQGRVYCQAVEWIQGPGGHRNPISWKLSDTIPLKVKAKGESPHIIYRHRRGLNVTAWTPRIAEATMRIDVGLDIIQFVDHSVIVSFLEGEDWWLCVISSF